MATRRKIITGLSVLWLTALTLLAAYAVHSSQAYNLPIPTLLSAFTLGLPPIAGLALEIVISLNKNLTAKGQLRTSRFFILTVAVLLVYETVIATLAGTHIAPAGGLKCGLREQWQDMFRRKQDGRVRRIQDTWSCCGFANTLDMPFPFPDRTHGANACVLAFGRDRSCMEPWRDEQRKVAVMLLMVPLMVFLWKLMVFTIPQTGPSWFSSTVHLADENARPNSGGRARSAIEYHDVQEANNEDLSTEVQRLNSESEVSAQVEGARVQPSGPLQDGNQWSRDREEA